MVRILTTSAALFAYAYAADTVAPTPAVSNPAWTMKTITSVQARVQSDPATWDEANQAFGLVLKQNTNTFEERYRAAMDTVNTASPEGALFYVQSEGIHEKLDVNCGRKTNMSYIWFMNVTIVQPTFVIAEMQDDTSVVPEYGHFVAMDNGACTPINSKSDISTFCSNFGGLNYTANLGPYIGGEPRIDHKYANYPNNIWFSFPNSCYTQTFTAKNDACRKAQPGGLCPRGTKPDGVKCTFSYDVLGYIFIDDLVGITNMTSKAGTKYRNRVEFCKDGKVEYNMDTDNSDLTFWNQPHNETANAERTQKMLDLYNAQLASGKGDFAHMKPLPKAADLTAINPPCWKNSPICAKATNGCRRKLMAQICEVCTSPGPDCVVMPANAPDAVPLTLKKQYVPPRPTDANGKPIVDGKGGNGGAASSASAIALSSLAVLGAFASSLF
uniref:Secreted protein n=1 Tax=Achlya hypogyna TaxID=1202772 RepID=A0A0A7CN49_ACHHY|nr:secreted protein [Achlya hypogyna]